jgi:hypothetical protein
MKTVTVVAHPTTGQVITPSTKNPEWGTFRVDSVNTSMENGIVNVSKRSAFIRGKISDIEALNLKAGQTLVGKIVKRESFEPFYEGQDPKIYPSGENMGQPVLTNGQKTYLEYVYSADHNALDVWVGQTSEELTQAAKKAMEEQPQ